MSVKYKIIKSDDKTFTLHYMLNKFCGEWVNTYKSFKSVAEAEAEMHERIKKTYTVYEYDENGSFLRQLEKPRY